jgi:hypothetical protein
VNQVNQRAFRAGSGVFVAGLALALVAACSHHSAPDQPGATADPASPGAVSPGGQSPGDQALGGGSAASAQPGGPGAGNACDASDLTLAQLPGGDAASGTVIVAIGLTNTSAKACTLNGYPVFTLTGGGHALPVTIQHGGMPVPPVNAPAQPVTVNPHARAGFLLVYQNRPASGGGSCSTATGMALKLGSATVNGDVQVSVCGQAVKVSPFVPGSKLTT